MIDIMRAKEEAMHKKGKKKSKRKGNKKVSEESWSLYILECSDGSFYTGITKDVSRRLKMHQQGKASRYTRTRGPVKLKYEELCGSHTAALVRECQVKAYPKQKKQLLIR